MKNGKSDEQKQKQKNKTNENYNNKKDNLRDVSLKSQPSANLKSPEIPEDIATGTGKWASAKNKYLCVCKHIYAEYNWIVTAINGGIPQTQQN